MVARARSFLIALVGCAALHGCSGDGDDAVVDARAIAEPILSAGLTEQEEWIRAEATRLVGLVPERVASAEYAALLSDPSPLVRGAALEALLRAGNNAARDAALRGLLTGSAQQRIQLLDLVVGSRNDALKRDALLQALRDANPEVRRAAILRLGVARVALPADHVERLLSDDDAGVVEATIEYLARSNPDAAATAVLSRLRASSAEVRAEGMMLASSLAIPALWPQMRSLARRGTPEQRTRAILALGRLGDTTVEEDLRSIVLNGAAEEAARALDALAMVDSPTARQQPLRHRRDNRIEVRRAAFAAMERNGASFDEFEIFLADSDPTVVRRAMRHIQTIDPERTARLVARSLADAADPVPVMLALYETAQEFDIRPLVRAALPQLQQVALSTNESAAWLATRVILTSLPVTELQPRLEMFAGDSATYALLEASLAAPRAADSQWYTESLEADLFLIRFLAALCIWRLDDAYAPNPPEAAGG